MYTQEKMRSIAEAVKQYNELDSTVITGGWITIISYDGIFVNYDTLKNSKN